jgi:hypothetical protein
LLAVCVDGGALAAGADATAVLELVPEPELPQPIAASGTSRRVNVRARCRTARKASDPP